MPVPQVSGLSMIADSSSFANALIAFSVSDFNRSNAQSDGTRSPKALLRITFHTTCTKQR